MKSVALLMLLLQVVNLLAQEDDSAGGSLRKEKTERPGESYIGRVWPSEKKSWMDDSSGYEITQWTSLGQNSHPYFTVESFIDDDTALIFSDRTGKKQLYRLNLINGEMTQMTKATRLRSMDHLPRHNMLWYLDGSVLKSLDTRTLEAKEVYDFAKFPYTVGSFSVTCDARWFVFSSNQKVATAEDGGYGPFVLYKLSLQDKSIAPITPMTGFNIGHVQANPVDPSLILYCWQWEALGRKKLVGDTPIRIWWVNIDGTDGGPLSQEFGLHRVHEAWTPDGRFVTFTGDYRFGLHKGKEIVGIQSIDGRTQISYDASVWHSHQHMAADNRHWVADLYNHDDRVLVMFTRSDSGLEKTEILFRHGSSWSGQSSHPHPHFSPGGKYILFSTDKTGTPQVYTVKVNLKL